FDRCLPARSRLCRSHSQGRKAGRLAGASTDEVPARGQPEDRQGARPRHSHLGPRPRRRGDRVRGRRIPSLPGLTRQSILLRKKMDARVMPAHDGVAVTEAALLARREFIVALALAAVAWSRAARAQQVERVRRIGVLMYWTADDAEGQARLAAFTQTLKQLGWTDLRIDTRWATADDIHRHAAELVALAPDVLVAATGTATVAALLQATRIERRPDRDGKPGGDRSSRADRHAGGPAPSARSLPRPLLRHSRWPHLLRA